jgi:hypothetical protein
MASDAEDPGTSPIADGDVSEPPPRDEERLSRTILGGIEVDPPSKVGVHVVAVLLVQHRKPLGFARLPCHRRSVWRFNVYVPI